MGENKFCIARFESDGTRVVCMTNKVLLRNESGEFVISGMESTIREAKNYPGYKQMVLKRKVEEKLEYQSITVERFGSNAAELLEYVNSYLPKGPPKRQRPFEENEQESRSTVNQRKRRLKNQYKKIFPNDPACLNLRMHSSGRLVRTMSNDTKVSRYQVGFPFKEIPASIIKISTSGPAFRNEGSIPENSSGSQQDSNNDHVPNDIYKEREGGLSSISDMRFTNTQHDRRILFDEVSTNVDFPGQDLASTSSNHYDNYSKASEYNLERVFGGEGSDLYDDKLQQFENNRDNSESDTDEIITSGNSKDTKESMSFSIHKTKELNANLIMKPNVKVHQALTLVIAASMRHHLTYDAVLTIMKVINNITVNKTLPTTKNGMWASLSRDDEMTMTRHLYCRDCKIVVGINKSVSDVCACEKRGPTTGNENLSYFIQLNLTAQLRELLTTVPGIAELLNYRYTRKKKNVDAIEDIYDGAEYQELCKPGHFLDDPYNYSFTLNADGLRVTNSSNASAWVVLLQINELPPQVRKRYMLLAGVWVDNEHPSLNTLLMPIVTELESLYENGVQWVPDGSEKKEVTSRFAVVVCSVDSMARPPILNMKQFNGQYGCTFCYDTGTSIPGAGVQRKYPVVENEPVVCRTDSEIRRDMAKALRKKKSVHGVHGHSAISLLPEFDLALGPIVESMHNLYLGVTKQVMMMLLFCPADMDWYAGKPDNLKAINTRLLNIRPPNKIARKPRVVQDMCRWKASEWRNWILYYAIPCLEGLIRQEDFNLVILLSRAAYTLNADSICIPDLEQTRLLLNCFVHNFQSTYGLQAMTFNVHLLRHLVDTVQNWGPLWANNAFGFESWNKKISDSVTSANSRALQIATRHIMNRFIISIMNDPETSQDTRKTIHSILYAGKQHAPPTPPMDHHNTIFELKPRGLVVESTWSCDEITAIRNAGFTALSRESLLSYEQAKINGIEYRCRGINVKTRFCNSNVYYAPRQNYGEVVKIVTFIKINGEEISGFVINAFDSIENAYGARHVQKIRRNVNNLVFVPAVGNTCEPAMVIETPIAIYALRLSNVWETD